MTKLTRRTVLKSGTAIVGGMAGILATGRAPAFAQGTTVHWLRWNDFVPASDQLLRRELLPAAEKALGLKINFETVNGNDLQPRITSAIQSGSGPDVIMLFNNHPQIYSESVIDLADLAGDVSKAEGGYYDLCKSNSSEGQKWLAVPWAIVGAMIAYRKSWFEEVGSPQFPDTWEKYREVGKKLKAKGRPIGQTLGHTFGDAPTFSYPYLWSWGGTEVEKDGKTVNINKKEVIESVKFMTAFWKEAHDEGGLAWDDTNNNRAFLGGEICATLNGASIYIAAKRGQEKIKDDKGEPLVRDIQHARLPAGPAGSSRYHTAFAHGVMKYGKNQKLAKDFLKWLHGKEQYSKWFQVAEGFSVGSTKFWEQHPLWSTIDEPMKGFRTAPDNSRTMGYAGPPNAKATEAYSKYVIVDMFAKGVQGAKPEDAVKWASDELKKIYG